MTDRSHLMSIEINDHCLLDAVNHTKEKPDGKCDISIDTEAAAMVRTTVMKASTNVDCPASLHSQPGCLPSNIHTNNTWQLL